MPGLICVAPSSNIAIDGALLEKMISAAMGRGHFQTDRFCHASFCGARLHLGTFNPGPQPVFNHDRSVAVMLDGELYGTAESGNDAKLCLGLYEKEGVDFIHRLNGSFIICIHDFNQRKTLVASDRFGSRPHFFAIDSNYFMLAPSAAAVARAGGAPRLDEAAVADWFAFGKLLGDKTFFGGVRAFPAGTIFSFQGGKADFDRYWDFPYSPDNVKSEARFVDELAQTLDRAMVLRTRPSRTGSVSLSGGLDSRLVAGLIPADARGNFRAFSFGGADCEEVRIAQKVANRLNLPWNCFDIEPQIITQGASEAVEITEGMDYIGVGYIPPIHKLAARDAEVVFDGFALDLTLGGSYLDKFSHVHDRERLKEAIYQTALFSHEERGELFNAGFYDKSQEWPRFSLEESFAASSCEDLANHIDKFFLDNHVRRFTMEGYRLMRSQVEHSSPAMDNGFIDVIMALPPGMRSQHRIYRRLLAKRFPKLAAIPYNSTGVRADAPRWLWQAGANFRSRLDTVRQIVRQATAGKVAFWTKRNYVDFEKWFAKEGSWREFFGKLLSDERNLLSQRYLSKRYIAKLFDQQYSGQRDNSMKIMYIATFELFLRRFFPDN